MSQYDEISILAGGYSALRYDVNRLPGWVLGINGSAIFARVDAALSMDRLFTEHYYTQLLALKIPLYLRDAALKNISPPLHRHVIRFTCDYTSSRMTDETGILNGTNSGLCGINLAYQLRPHTLFLFGMDLCRGPHGESHWYPNYPFPSKTGGPVKGTSAGTFAKWQRDLSEAVSQCQSVGINVKIMTSKKT